MKQELRVKTRLSIYWSTYVYKLRVGAKRMRLYLIYLTQCQRWGEELSHLGRGSE